MKNKPKLPQYLIRFIGRWVCNEYLHVVYCGGEHWNILVDDLLSL